MRVLIVCSGNIARSPTLAALLQARRPDLTVTSAGLSQHAGGKRMARRMRDYLATVGLRAQAEHHRSRGFEAALAQDDPHLIIATTEHHAELVQSRCRVLCQTTEHVNDPAFGGAEGYAAAWTQLQRIAEQLEQTLPRSEDTHD